MTQAEIPTSKRPGAVRVRLLGDFSVSVGSRTIRQEEWSSKKAAALIKLLALAPGHRLHRERVMDLLWPDLGKGKASNNLRQVLYGARGVLDPGSGSPERYLRLRARTAANHVAKILKKLGLSSRTQIAGWATESQPSATDQT